MTDTPLWRQAIQDKSHALHQAAWLIFAADVMSFKLADRQLSDKREAVIAFCLAILDGDELYTVDAPAKGYAPANAARLLGHWQVTEALPRLLHVLRYEAIETLAYTGTSEGLIEMGEAAVPALLDLGASYSSMDDSPELPLTISGILSRIGKGKPEVFTYMQQVFRSILPDEGAYEYMAELFIEWDSAQGRAYLEECLKQSYFRLRHKMIRRVLQNFTPDA